MSEYGISPPVSYADSPLVRGGRRFFVACAPQNDRRNTNGLKHPKGVIPKGIALRNLSVRLEQRLRWGFFVAYAPQNDRRKQTFWNGRFRHKLLFPLGKVMIKKELLQHEFHAATAQVLSFCNFNSFNMGAFFCGIVNCENNAHHHGVGICPVKSGFLVVNNSSDGYFLF